MGLESNLRYTFLTDKAFRAHPVGNRGGAKAACCDWDLCNGFLTLLQSLLLHLCTDVQQALQGS
jgi:hypothetical protein